MKLLIWTNYPNHYQAAFFQQLRLEGVDLQVRYYEPIHPSRLSMGWENPHELPAGEQMVSRLEAALDSVPDWRERIHIIPGGHSRPLLFRLTTLLCSQRVPWVHWSETSIPGLMSFLKTPLKKFYAKRINRYGLGAFAIGTRAWNEFRQWGVRPEKIALLPYSVPAGNVNVPLDEPCRLFTGRRNAFLFLGSMYRRKGVDTLLEAFRDAVAGNKEWVLLIVGDDRENGAYQRMAAAKGLGERVLFRGAVRFDGISGVIKCARVLVLPSRHDGWGVVLNEAASHGLALIASENVGAAYHLIDPGANGFRVKTGSADSLRAAMRAYIDNSELAEKHGRNTKRIYQSYTVEHNAKHLIEVVSTWAKM